MSLKNIPNQNSPEDYNFLEAKGVMRETPYKNFIIDKGNYIVKTAETKEELIATFKLRYTVYGAFYSKKPDRPIDVDEFDKNADHIIVINKELNKVVGTYRILSSDHVDSFYTEREFNIDEFKKTAGRIAEMGRATVDTEARSGVVITLLWRGVAEYIKLVEAEHLIGCATFWTNDKTVALDAWHYFNQIGVLLKTKTTPCKENIIDNWAELIETTSRTPEEIQAIKKSLPPLVKSYIKAGAIFGSEPARDNKLSSYDFLATCKMSDLSQNLVKKYF